MATSNVTVTTAWTEVGATGSINVAIQCDHDDATYEIASIAAHSAPTVKGLRVRGRKIVTREHFGAGYVYARLVAGSVSCNFISSI